MGSISEFRNNIPLNPARPGDGSGFLPIYDPEAIGLARRFNWLVGIIVGVVGALVLLLLIFFVAYTFGQSDSEQLSGALGTTLIPLFLVMLSAIVLGLIIRAFSVKLDRVYTETQRELEGWLKLQTGREFGGPEKLEKSDLIQFGVLTALFGFVVALLNFDEGPKHYSRASLSVAAELIAQGKLSIDKRTISVLDHDVQSYQLERSKDGSYRLATVA